MRILGLLAALLLALATPAYAGLFGAGHTIDAQFYLGAHIAGDLEDESGGPVSLTTTLTFASHALDLSTIDVSDAQIVITTGGDPGPEPYCSTALPCSDSFTGFEFIFGGGVAITGITVDGSSSASMFPVNPGGLLPSATDILVDLTGDAPAVGDKLVLDLTFGVVTTPVPEPASLLVFGSALLAIGVRARRKRRS